MAEGVLLGLSWMNLLSALVGVILGLAFGVIPGLTATLGVALLVPVTFIMPAESGMIMLAGIYAGAIYAGTITAILINIPGTPASIPSLWDGYVLTQKGQARSALGVAALSSGIGGVLSGVVLFSLSPVLARVALRLGPPEYAALVLFGLVVVVVLVDAPLSASASAALVGLGLGTIGLDPIIGTSRFTFGFSELSSGVGLVPFLVGVFAFTEAIKLALRSLTTSGKLGKLEMGGSKLMPPFHLLRTNSWNFIRSSGIGVGLGVLPAIGPESTPFISYAVAKRASKDSSSFGKGSYEGLIAAEASNNANVGGSLIPLLTLGIPGSGVAAVFVGALTLHGLRPGPMLFVQQREIMYALFTGFIVVNVLMLVVGIFLVKQFALILKAPPSVVAVAVAFFSIIGGYAVGANMFGIAVMFFGAALAALMQFARLPVAPLVLALILGPLFEQNLVRALSMSRGDPLIFLQRPVSLGILAVTLVAVVLGRRARPREASAPTTSGSAQTG